MSSKYIKFVIIIVLVLENIFFFPNFKRFENRFGSLQLTIYCPFWMINKTGLMLSYRVSANFI